VNGHWRVHGDEQAIKRANAKREGGNTGNGSREWEPGMGAGNESQDCEPSMHVKPCIEDLMALVPNVRAQRQPALRAHFTTKARDKPE
jgi:hypothetical protein